MVTLIIGFTTILLFILGSAIGSFLLVVGDRAMANENPFIGRSRCDHCKKTLRWYELIPFFSFITHFGRCAQCKKELSVAYPLFELFAGLLCVGVIEQAVFSGQHLVLAIVSYIVACILLILIRIDSVSMILPDHFIVLLLVTACVAGLIMHRPLGDMLLGVLAGAGFLYLLWMVTRGAGIGFGDVKLMIPLGILFGFQGTVTLLIVAFFIGGAMGIWLIGTKQAGPKTAIPFGPFLAMAAFAILLIPDLPDRFFRLLGVQ